MDICFLLAVCVWIKNWQQVIDYAYDKAEVLLFETNATSQAEHIAYLKQKYATLLLINENSDDDVIQKKRQTYLCLKNK